MAHFNLEDYETVEMRIRRFYENHPDGRIITDNVTQPADRAQGMWIVKAFIYLSTGDQANDLPKSTGYAFEIDGQGMANKTSALENCETSAIGRALANMDMSGNKRTSREEMEKVQRGVTPTKAAVPIPDFFDNLIEDAPSLPELEKLWATAVEGGYSEQVKDLFSKRKKELNK